MKQSSLYKIRNDGAVRSLIAGLSSKRGNPAAREVLEIIADNLSNAGWSGGYVSALDSEGRTIWIADAHREGKRFIVRADEKLTAFLISMQPNLNIPLYR